MLIKLFELGICLFEGYMCFSFWNSFLKLRNSKKWFPIMTTGITMSVLFGINQLHRAGLNLIMAIVLSMVLCQILFSDSVPKKIFYVILSSFVIVCCEFVMIGILNLPLGVNSAGYDNAPAREVLTVISSKLLSLLALRLICHVSNNGKNLFFPSQVPYFTSFPIACLVTYIGIAYSTIDFQNMETVSAIILIGCILLLAANIILFIIYDKVIFMMDCVKEYELTEIKRKLENQHYMQIEEINRKHGEIIHDMNNYLKTIQRLAEKEENNEIVEIIGSLNSHIVKVEEENFCKDQILNAILNGKKQEAIIKKINYSVYVEPGFRKPDIEDIDLISIMSNLIDNAIEAASKCSDGIVDIQMYKANDGRFTTIKITNNYKERPMEKDGEFITQKKNPSVHGIGIRNVKSTVEQYGGWTSIEYGKDYFCVTIMFA